MDLRTAVATRARIEGGLLLVDEFLNHSVDPEVIAWVGEQLATELSHGVPDVVVTAEASGIPPAMACAAHLRIPMIYAKKYLGTGARYTFAREVASPTKGVEYRVEIARRVLQPGLRVAIVDDFLARGRTAEALGEIVTEAACVVTGFGFAIEKVFMEGRARLTRHGWPVHSLVRVASLDDDTITLE